MALGRAFEKFEDALDPQNIKLYTWGNPLTLSLFFALSLSLYLILAVTHLFISQSNLLYFQISASQGQR